MKSIISILFCFFISISAFAKDGSSGCGPGWYLLKKNSIVSSSLRATTNAVFAPTVTIGMTFGTSNCSKHSIVKNEQKSLHFTNENYIELIAEVSKGEGEFLTAYAKTIGCKSSAHPLFKKEVKNNFSKIYPNTDINPERALGEVYKVIFRNKELTQLCSLG